jgi:hypothetical protein
MKHVPQCAARKITAACRGAQAQEPTNFRHTNESPEVGISGLHSESWRREGTRRQGMLSVDLILPI